MAARRSVLPLKLLMATYFAVLHAVCLCQAAGVARVDAAHTAAAEHDCCHDDAGANGSGEAPDGQHSHHPGCRHCDGATLLPATEVSGPIVSYVAPIATLPPALTEWVVAGVSAQAHVVAPPSSLAHHPPLPVLVQTGILLI